MEEEAESACGCGGLGRLLQGHCLPDDSWKVRACILVVVHVELRFREGNGEQEKDKYRKSHCFDDEEEPKSKLGETLRPALPFPSEFEMFCLNGTMLELLLMYMDLNKLEGAIVVDGRLIEVLGNFLRLLLTATI